MFVFWKCTRVQGNCQPKMDIIRVDNVSVKGNDFNHKKTAKEIHTNMYDSFCSSEGKPLFEYNISNIWFVSNQNCIDFTERANQRGTG